MACIPDRQCEWRICPGGGYWGAECGLWETTGQGDQEPVHAWGQGYRQRGERGEISYILNVMWHGNSMNNSEKRIGSILNQWENVLKETGKSWKIAEGCIKQKVVLLPNETKMFTWCEILPIKTNHHWGRSGLNSEVVLFLRWSYFQGGLYRWGCTVEFK